MKKIFAGAVLAVVAGLPMSTLGLEEGLDTQTASDAQAAASQSRIDKLADQKAQDLQRFRIATQRLESLEIYNRQLQKLIESQNAEITSIMRQTEEIENIETGALPLTPTVTSVGPPSARGGRRSTRRIRPLAGAAWIRVSPRCSATMRNRW